MRLRKSTRELLKKAHGIDIRGYKDLEYLDLLRNEIDESRILFAEWVKTFDCWNYMIDRWDLLNPPGINYVDHDPNDDNPFNNKDM